MNPDMVFSYTRDLIERLTEARPDPDRDGDLPFRYLDAHFYARVHPNVPVVQIFSVAVDSPTASPEMYEVLNDLNCRLIYARTFFIGEQVLFECDIDASNLSPRELDQACRHVASATDAFAREVHERFQGQMAFDFGKGQDYENRVATQHELPTGLYL